MNIILTIIGLIGITIIITAASIFEPARVKLENFSKTLGTLARCQMCAGFWAGFSYAFVTQLIHPLLMGGAIAAMAWAIYAIIDYFVIKGTYYAVKIEKETIDDSEDTNA